VANDDAYSVTQDTMLTVDAAGVLSNDTDADTDPLTALQVTGADSGTATLNSDGSFTYTPNTGFTGIDSFTYYASDGTDDSNVASITIDVTGAMACADYASKSECNNEPACEWTGHPKNGSCQEAATCTVTEDPELTCDDGIDNDCDGNIDSEDSDCSTPVDCSQYADKTSCNAEITCRWDNKNKVCISN
jgi:VCBS repeat-containing protein